MLHQQLLPLNSMDYDFNLFVHLINLILISVSVAVILSFRSPVTIWYALAVVYR